MDCICRRLASKLPWISFNGSFTQSQLTMCSPSSDWPISSRKDSDTTEFSVLS